MTWNWKDDRYLLKFRLNLHKKMRGIPSGEDLDSEFLQDKTTPITKKNILSVACQFYDPAGLAAPLMVPVRSLLSIICRDKTCSMLGPLSADRDDKFRFAVEEILKTKELSFPIQLVFNNSGQSYIFFYGSLQGYGACIYMHSLYQFNILTSSANCMGKSTYSTPQSEISGAILAVKMEQKVSQELYNISLSNPVFIGDSEIVLRMIARNDPTNLPIFYGTRIMQISALTNADNWFWCPGILNPADLLTRSGSTLEKIRSRFWLQGSFLSTRKSSWPTKSCASLLLNKTPNATIIKLSYKSINSLTEVITEFLKRFGSFSKVLSAMWLLRKATRTFKFCSSPTLPILQQNNAWNFISSSIISCFNSSTEAYIAKNKLKHLLIQPEDGIYYVSKRSFQSCIGVPLICWKSLLARCIVQDAHNKLGHGHDILQMLSSILAEFYIPGCKKLVIHNKKICPGCLRLNKKPFFAFEVDVLDILKIIQPPFSFCQADIFGTILAYNQDISTKCWVLVVLCLSSRAVQLLRPNYHQSIPEHIFTLRYPSHHMDSCWIKYL